MNGVPLFSVDDLSAAFGLILSPTAARKWAEEWFRRFADDDLVDARGYYLYTRWDGDRLGRNQPDIASAPPESERSEMATGYEDFCGRSENEKGEQLMYFSDLHLNLLALASEDLYRRVQSARGDTDERAEHRRRQTLSVVDVMRRS